MKLYLCTRGWWHSRESECKVKLVGTVWVEELLETDYVMTTPVLGASRNGKARSRKTSLEKVQRRLCKVTREQMRSEIEMREELLGSSDS